MQSLIRITHSTHIQKRLKTHHTLLQYRKCSPNAILLDLLKNFAASVCLCMMSNVIKTWSSVQNPEIK